MNLPSNVKYIISSLQKGGYEAFVVGGCVRDYLLGDEPKDFDITTSALPEQIKGIFNHTVDTGIKHGTVTVVLNNNNYEVTTYRIDGEYTNNRHPEQVFFSKKVQEDLSRRDFTMNAIAYNEQQGFIDEFKGMEDIENRIIRCVGYPDVRFNEDALRMMRAIRFSVQLGFDIDNRTLKSIEKNSKLIEHISIERIREEFVKLLNSRHLMRAKLLLDTGILEHFLPEIKHIFENRFDETMLILSNVRRDTSLRLAMIFSRVDEITVSDILKRFKFDNNTIRETTIIRKFIYEEMVDDYYETRKLMSKVKVSTITKILDLKFVMARIKGDLHSCKVYENIFDEVTSTISKGHCYNLKMLDLNGDDLKNLGITDGKKIGELLSLGLDIVLKSPEKNNKEILLGELSDKI